MSRSVMGTIAPSVLALAVGCGGVVRGAHLRDEDEVLNVGSELRATGQRHVQVQQRANEVQVDVFELCQRIERREVERRHVYAREGKNAIMFIIAGIGGLGAGALGASYLIRADQYPDEDSRAVTSSDTFTRQDALFAGGLLVTAGAALVSAALGYLIRVSRTEAEVERLTVDGDILEARADCSPPRPVAAVTVRATWPGASFTLGDTSHTGILRTDLLEREELLPEPRRRNVSLSVEVDGVDSGRRIELGPVRAMRDELHWERSEAGRCIEPDRAEQCQGLRDYLASFPEGTHAEEARRLLREARPALERAAERRVAEQAAAAERLRAAIAAREAEMERQRLEEERLRREEEAARQRVIAEAEARREADRRRYEEQMRQAEARRRRAERRRQCRRTCERSCNGVRACVRECEATSCR